MARAGSAPVARAREGGFTLVEVTIALLIFGMIAAAAVALFTRSVRAGAATVTRLDRNATETRMLALLSADLAQAVPRTSRDTAGARLPAFSGSNGVGSAPVLAFVRGGVSNPGEAPRGALQRIEWRVTEGRLLRIAYPNVDGATTSLVVPEVESVERVAARYRGRDGWSDQWRPERADELPRAVELTLTQANRAPFVMAFLVGAGS